MVLDASVVLKWFMEERESDKAYVLKERHVAGKFTITVPDILIYEVGNALRYEPEFSSKEVNFCLEQLYELNLSIIAPLPDLADLTTKIAYQKDITFYDASYIALAEELNFQYVTADKKLYNKLKDFPLATFLSMYEIDIADEF